MGLERLDLRLPVAAYEGKRSFADAVAGTGPSGHATEAEILETSLTRSCQKALTNLRSVCSGKCWQQAPSSVPS